ncbi:MAG: TrmH family RNA methyltransferase, partial [Bacteroidota bacterium]
MSKQTTFEDERSDIKKRLENIQTNRHPFALLLDHIVDEVNMGSVFRLADAVRLEKIYLYNEVSKNWNGKKLKRIARSTNKYVLFEEINTIEQVSILKKEYEFIGLEVTKNSISYQDFELPAKKP